MRRACDACGAKYEAKRATSRYCSSRCRTRASRGTVTALRKQPAPPPPTGTVRASTLAALTDAGRVDTPLGQTALVLAERLDSRADTGSAIASVAKQLQATLEAATANATLAVNPLDELRARRATRGA